jgi:uncharacterized protein (DUF362 family)
MNKEITRGKGWTRRKFLGYSCVGAAASLAASSLPSFANTPKKPEAETFIAKVDSYNADIASIILAGLGELGVTSSEIKGTKILLKPNLVETTPRAVHINTHPLVVRGAVEAFLYLGAAQVLVAEGSGHCRDSLLVLEESGLAEVLLEDRIPFVDLNYDDIYTVPNGGRYATDVLTKLTFPVALKQVDWIVSMPKLKTHHWVGVTLSMKNLFGVMPGMAYGWPKNILHWAGIKNSILDINATLQPDFAIVDGIIGMEGDGPIMGTPCHAGAIILGRNLPAVDATCARIMGINPYKVTYLAAADGWLGTIDEGQIRQRGERIESIQKNFILLDKIPAQRGLR